MEKNGLCFEIKKNSMIHKHKEWILFLTERFDHAGGQPWKAETGYHDTN